MLSVAIVSVALVLACTLVHYEALNGLTHLLPRLKVPDRSKLLIVMLVAFVAHAVEIGLYAVALRWLIADQGAGTLAGLTGSLFTACIFLSAETYTSLGYGDFTPHGPVRLLAGVEALNGLLLIGWTASYTYLAMEKFWNERAARKHAARSTG